MQFLLLGFLNKLVSVIQITSHHFGMFIRCKFNHFIFGSTCSWLLRSIIQYGTCQSNASCQTTFNWQNKSNKTQKQHKHEPLEMTLERSARQHQ